MSIVSFEALRRDGIPYLLVSKSKETQFYFVTNDVQQPVSLSSQRNMYCYQGLSDIVRYFAFFATHEPADEESTFKQRGTTTHFSTYYPHTVYFGEHDVYIRDPQTRKYQHIQRTQKDQISKATYPLLLEMIIEEHEIHIPKIKEQKDGEYLYSFDACLTKVESGDEPKIYTSTSSQTGTALKATYLSGPDHAVGIIRTTPSSIIKEYCLYPDTIEFTLKDGIEIRYKFSQFGYRRLQEG